MTPGPGRLSVHCLVLDTLGAGGMGVVFGAGDTMPSRRVALKFLSPATPSAGNGRERLLREARAASSLNHPHICTVYEIGEHEGLPFIAMEWLDGQTLNVSEGPLLAEHDQRIQPLSRR